MDRNERPVQTSEGRGRLERWWVVVFSLALIAVVVIALIALVPRRDEPVARKGASPAAAQAQVIETAGYVLSDFNVKMVAKDEAEVHFMVRWAGPNYPGPHACRWFLFDADERLVADEKQDFYAPTKESHPQYSTIHGLTGRAETATVECSPRRKTDPEGVYDTTLVDVTLSSATSGAYVKKFRWAGEGRPDINACTLRIVHRGKEIARYDFTLTAFRPMSRLRSTFTLDRPADVPSGTDFRSLDLSASTLECVPF